jgi:hypothetical protein
VGIVCVVYDNYWNAIQEAAATNYTS